MLRKESADPIEYLSQPMNSADRQWLMDGERTLWCAAVLGLVAGRPIRHAERDVCGFSRTTVSLDNNGTVNTSRASGSHEVMRFEIKDQANFAVAATKATAELLTKFPLAVPHPSRYQSDGIILEADSGGHCVCRRILFCISSRNGV